MVRGQSGFTLERPASPFAAAARTIAGVVVLPGLVLLRDAGGRPGATAGVVVDSTSWHGSQSGPSPRVMPPVLLRGIQPDRLRNALAFPSASSPSFSRSRVVFDWPFDEQNEFSLQTWVRVTEVQAGSHLVVASRSATPFYYPDPHKWGWHVYVGNGAPTDRHVYVEVGHPEGFTSLVSRDQLPLGQWTHLVVSVSERQGVRLFIDDTEDVASANGGAIAQPPTGTEGGLAIGGFLSSPGSHTFRGDIAWLTLYSPTLSRSEVGELYRMGLSALSCAGSIS